MTDWCVTDWRRDRGSLVPFGPEAEAAARVYAARTSRPLGQTRLSAFEIEPATRGVVATTSKRLNAALLDRLYPVDGTDASVPGLLLAPDEAALLTLATRLPVVTAAWQEGPVIELFATEQLGDQVIAGRRILGDNAGAETIREVVTAPAAILSLITHSNGYDLYLGGGLSLCNALRAKGRPTSGAPCCQITGRCFRQHLSLEDAAKSGRVIEAGDLKARIIVLYTCLGLLGSFETRRWGYAEALLANGHVATVILGWSLAIPDGGELQALLDGLYGGLTAGQAVARVNRRRPLARLAVLGEPDSRIGALPAEQVSILRYEAPRPGISGDGGRFLHALCYAVASNETGPARTLAGAAAARVLAYENLTGLGLEGLDVAVDGQGMRLAVLAVLAEVGHLFSHHWLPLAGGYDRRLGDACPRCESLVEHVAFHFRAAGLGRRELVLCPACGIARDAPPGDNPRLRLHGDTLVLEGDLPADGWSAIAYLGCQARELSLAFAWPPDASGSPCRRFTPPNPWPPGPLVVALMLIVKAELCMVATVAQGPEGNEPELGIR